VFEHPRGPGGAGTGEGCRFLDFEFNSPGRWVRRAMASARTLYTQSTIGSTTEYRRKLTSTATQDPNSTQISISIVPDSLTVCTYGSVATVRRWSKSFRGVTAIVTQFISQQRRPQEASIMQSFSITCMSLLSMTLVLHSTRAASSWPDCSPENDGHTPYNGTAGPYGPVAR